MKIPIVGVILLAASLLLIPFNPMGCSTSSQKTAYQTSAVTHVSVKAAMKAWNLYVASGKASIKDEQKVKAAYQKYQASQLGVINAVQQFTIVPNDADAQDKLAAEVQAASESLSALMGLLNQFGVVK